MSQPCHKRGIAGPRRPLTSPLLALGHADIGITLQTYSHVLPAMQREAAAIFAAAIAEAQ